MTIRERRLQKAEDNLKDSQAYLAKWSWGMFPSEKRKAQEEIDRLSEKVIKLRNGVK